MSLTFKHSSMYYRAKLNLDDLQDIYMAIVQIYLCMSVHDRSTYFINYYQKEGLFSRDGRNNFELEIISINEIKI